ncbi:hypothetical protein D7X33_19110, partial [Butyricicoccus sp. 1XD8-22]
ANEEAVDYWLEVRREFAKNFNTKFEGPIRSIEETEEEEQTVLEELGLLNTATEPFEPNAKVKYEKSTIPTMIVQTQPQTVKPKPKPAEESKPEKPQNTREQHDNELLELLSQPPMPTLDEIIEDLDGEVEDQEVLVVEEEQAIVEDVVQHTELDPLSALIKEYEPPPHPIEESTADRYTESIPSDEQNAALEAMFGVSKEK